MKKVLIVIDIQNDYFSGGGFPLWNTENVLKNIEKAIISAKEKDIPVIIVKHVADKSAGIAPFFNEGTHGVDIHENIMKLLPDAKIVVKKYADGFYDTTLEEVLSSYKAEEILVCGMMTQNCVTHTAISKNAEKYSVKVLTDCCTSVNEAIHMIALHALSTRIKLVSSEDEF